MLNKIIIIKYPTILLSNKETLEWINMNIIIEIINNYYEEILNIIYYCIVSNKNYR